MMRNLILLAIFGEYLQVVKCNPKCPIYGSIAACTSQSLYQVPALPPYITILYMRDNYISEINETSFSGLEGLKELDLSWQQVNGLIIRTNTFQRLENLAVLYLGYNTGLQIEPDSFVGLSNLRALSLYRCDLTESILQGDYLKPLVSLETLDLYGNQVKRIQPALFFVNMTDFQELNVSLNRMESICEEDLLGFQGKHFRLLKLNSLYLYSMTQYGFDWKRCGNPFRNMSMETLDLSSNGFDVDKAKLFFNAIQGTKIHHLILERSTMGKSFGFSNVKDPDKQTFEGLKNSSVKILDLSKCFIFTLQYAVFSPLREVEDITIAQNKINQIDREAFFGLQNVQKLNLSHNLIGEIYSYTFDNLPNILELDLSYNHIGALGYQAFKGLPNLQVLDLTGNSIRELGTYGSLAPLPNIQLLRLADNKITSLDGLSVFAPNTIILNVQNNRLTNLEDVYTVLAKLMHIEFLWYGNNFIKWCTLNNNISVPALNSLKLLELRNIALQMIWARGECMHVFQHLGKLLSLDLSFNSLQTLPDGIFKGLISLEEMDLHFNSLTYLKPDIFPESLKTVDLSYNFLASPDPEAFHSLSWINLYRNQFHCDCGLEDFLTWLKGTNVTFPDPGVNEFSCEFPSDLHGISLLNFSSVISCEEDDERLVQELRLSLFIGCTALIILIMVGSIVFARLRGFLFKVYKKLTARILEGPRRDPSADGPRYDAYLCFSNNDYKWVETALLKRLDSQFAERNVLRCCFEVRDFIPGEDHLFNIRDAIWGSRKTVCIVSKEFLKDGWCLEAFTLAQSRMLEELRDVLIMVVVGNVPHYRLMKHECIRTFARKREYLQWPEDTQDIQWFYEKLMSKILKDKKNTAKDNNGDITLVNMTVGT
ncbi:toll-like receptor 5 [Oncorhynchus nerka]|uniref:toll-like receptor 5 n=1 Tax=Oncorhynchus nerka TaxID=8023 RepID=UPI00113220DD|nr:toll-like receptor 5 [Oncorhynchus nerka]